MGELKGPPKFTQPGRWVPDLRFAACIQELLRPHLEHVPTAPQHPCQSPGGRAALHPLASWLVPELSAAAPQSSRNVCVRRCLWRRMYVSCFAFPFSSWQVMHFPSTHWVNFRRFKTIAGERSALGSHRGSGHGTSGIVS